MLKKCLVCEKKLIRKNKESYGYFEKRKFCSRKCFFKWLSAHPHSANFKKGFTPWNKGTKGIMKAWNKGLNGYKAGKNHWKWKENDVSYKGLHDRIRKQLGTPTKCAHCGKDGLTGRQIGWANIDHKYKRNLNDWIRLCASCHKKYDLKNNSTSGHTKS